MNGNRTKYELTITGLGILFFLLAPNIRSTIAPKTSSVENNAKVEDVPKVAESACMAVYAETAVLSSAKTFQECNWILALFPRSPLVHAQPFAHRSSRCITYPAVRRCGSLLCGGTACKLQRHVDDSSSPGPDSAGVLPTYAPRSAAFYRRCVR
jgi:hypothetical protein